jgi:menaquinone-specific isochorismate synthase
MTTQISLAKFSINSRQYSILKNQIEIKPIDLFSQLSKTDFYPKVYWSHRDDEESRIAFGKILGSYRIPIIKLKEEITGPSFDPRFYGGRSFEGCTNKKSLFESFRRQYFFLPKYEIVQRKESTFLNLYEIATGDLDVKEIAKPPLFYEILDDTFDFKVTDFKHIPTYDVWDKQITSLIHDIQTKKLDKAVIARQSSLSLNQEMNPFALLKKLQGSFLKSSFFCFQFKPTHSFLGATPECLYSRNNSFLKTEAIAGTTDLLKKTNLLESNKEVGEFSYVTQFISAALEKISSNLLKSKDKTVNVGYLRHLYSQFEAKLKPEVTDQNIIDSLFPSPALSGYPQDKALSKINELEDFNRDWYASPIGWISQSRAELIIAIRSCLISKLKVHLFVGNGIVKDSTPKKEWEELDIKMSPFLKLFNHESH